MHFPVVNSRLQRRRFSCQIPPRNQAAPMRQCHQRRGCEPNAVSGIMSKLGSFIATCGHIVMLPPKKPALAPAKEWKHMEA